MTRSKRYGALFKVLKEVSYNIAPRGLAESFTESEAPPDYALIYRNRFMNSAGGAEKRRGIQQLGSTITGTPKLTGAHELVKKDGTAVLLVSGQGTIWEYDGTSTYTQRHTGLNSTARLRSIQMGDKLIFDNGVDRRVFTKDGVIFTELKAIIDRGQSTTGTDQDSLHDSDVTNWVTDSFVAVNDLLYNPSKDAYAVVNAVATASVGHTEISASAASAIGVVSATAQEVGDRYELIDLVELNIIPTDGENDNAATSGSGTDENSIVVSAVADWTATDIRVEDWVRNTTRAGVCRVSAIATASLSVTGVSGQTSGDSLIFMKSAMPIAIDGHIHFGRAYSIDERDRAKVRISGTSNPEDMTTDAGTLDSTTFSFGDTQPQGDSLVTMGTFQRFLVLLGKQNIYLYEGVDPIADTSAATVAFDVRGLFPHGAVSQDAALSTGNDFVFASSDGIQAVSLVDDATNLNRANLSEQLKTTLRDLFETTSSDDIRMFHYQRRSWVVLVVGTKMYVFNYTVYLGYDKVERARATVGTLPTQAGSWSLFDGKFARQNNYLVRADGTLICVGDGGKVYEFDKSGVFDDDGEIYDTEYGTVWLTGDEPKKRVRIKQGHYIKPIIDAGGNVTYTIRAEAGFDAASTDTVTVVASGGSEPIGLAIVGTAVIGGSSVQNRKYPLRWRGEQVRLNFKTSDNIGPDILSRFTLYATVWGRR